MSELVFGSEEANAKRAPHLDLCPFCGGGQLIERVGSGFLPFFVECDTCSAQGPHHRTAEKARDGWNKRNGATYPQ